MNRNKPKPFQRYRHFKGNEYQVICIAKDADTGEDVVVYQALYGDYAVYTRLLSQFLSEVDREKYPNAAQKYRFQEIAEQPMDVLQQRTDAPSGLQQTEVLRESTRQISMPQDERQGVSQSPFSRDKGQSTRKLEIAEPRPGEADPALLAFLDADTMEEKSDVLVSIRHRITNRLIDDFAVTLDVVIPEGSVDVRYQQLLSSIRMVQKYEIERPR